MKFFKYSVMVLFTSFLIASCSEKEDPKPDNVNEVEQLQLLNTLTGDGYKVELFNETGAFKVGYNPIFLRITDKNGDYVQEANIDWMPMMTMNMHGMIHEHGCPFSPIQKVADKKTLFEGYIVFIMASDGPDNFWDLEVNFTANGESVSVNQTINVVSTDSDFNKEFASVTGTDNVSYFAALIEPSKPQIGTNDITVGLFKMGEHHDFPVVNNYKIKVDPRMPSMGNHSAPGNEDMVQGSDGFYHGKVGFSMSGYWKINLILEDNNGNVVKGEPISEQNEESSLNFRLEF